MEITINTNVSSLFKEASKSDAYFINKIKNLMASKELFQYSYTDFNTLYFKSMFNDYNKDLRGELLFLILIGYMDSDILFKDDNYLLFKDVYIEELYYSLYYNSLDLVEFNKSNNVYNFLHSLKEFEGVKNITQYNEIIHYLLVMTNPKLLTDSFNTLEIHNVKFDMLYETLRWTSLIRADNCIDFFISEHIYSTEEISKLELDISLKKHLITTMKSNYNNYPINLRVLILKFLFLTNENVYIRSYKDVSDIMEDTEILIEISKDNDIASRDSPIILSFIDHYVDALIYNKIPIYKQKEILKKLDSIDNKYINKVLKEKFLNKGWSFKNMTIKKYFISHRNN